MDMAGSSPQGGSGSGSGSGLQICSDSTPDSERVNNKPVFVPAPPSHSPTGSPQPRTPTRRHRHHHQGLLSPIPSFAALLSPASSRPVTPSPLRILHPSTPTTPSLALTPATAISLLFSTDTETYTYPIFDLEDMPVHQPRPQHPEPSSSAHLRPTTPSRPPSRSEKLLREALLRDQDRPPMPHSPYTAAAVPTLSSISQSRSPGNARHRRRHSEVPAQYPSPTEHARIFRSPATSPRAPSPEPSPSLARRHSHTQRQQQQQVQQQYHHGYQASQASHSPTRSTHLARRPSVNSQPRGASPSSTTRSRGHTHPTTNTSGISRNRVPQPLPLGPESHYHPSQYPQYPHHVHQHQQQHQQQQQEKVVMTPHEQVLRARLEQVLQSGKVVRSPAAKGTYDEWRREDSSPTADDEHNSSFGSSSNEGEGSGSGEDDNVVRDENGLARPWKRSPRGTVQVGGMMSPPTTTSGSGSGSTSARSESQERVYVRSRTEPVLPAMMQQLPASPYQGHPRRSATAPGAPGLRGMGMAPPSAGHRYHPHHHHHHHHHQRSGTTPPLVSDGSPTPPEDEDEDEDEFDEEEEEYEGDLEGRGMRMLTPPLTPPSHMASAYHGYYVPSPYFNGKGLAPVSAGKERRGRTLVGRGRPSVHHGVVDLEGSEEDEHEYVEGEVGEGYFGSGGVGVDDAVYRAHMARQFNVRRASAKAREMEGYVSFSAVEGLGAPPESGSSEEEDERKEGKKGGVGGWVRRLWGSEGQVVV
ncbi:hypothetical protein D9611_010858 [Ephemerocybe angulata]|uniref:Uncharacterized protein n=1 Tax=Ephemerocybe angulata TaxID=980116 RepID=A0A8H5C4P4_9AGAR|nr:hypothetical protein D9611_010858 [Tulosesus angulatus]